MKFKMFEDGVYKLISPKSKVYEKEHISKWVQVLPENIKAGHTYLLTTDNLNYQNNGFSRTIYLRGDITAKGAPVASEFNVIDGIPSYYFIDGEPIDNTKWTVSNVPDDDPDYETFKDYLMFTNEGGKRLTLTGYINGNNINWIYKYSGKNGYIASENAMYTNKVMIIPVEDSNGTFYIGTKNLLPEPNNIMQYITLSSQNQYRAGSNIDNATQFKAYEYVDKDIDVDVTLNYEEPLCERDEIVLNKESEYKRKIGVKLSCENCEDKKEKGITIQLFADGLKVEDGEITLNSQNGFEYRFDNLPVVYDESKREIEYEVKIVKDGQYYSIPETDISYNKKTIQKWVQVQPETIKAGHTYVLTTDNLNYENNGFSRIIYLRGDITAKGAAVVPEYNVIDGNSSYYCIDGEPIDNTRWTVSNVPDDDPGYDIFKDYLMFTNEGGKKLTLTGYNNGNNNINWIYKHSGRNGYIESEDALYTNKVTLTSVENSGGEFYIGTRNLFPEPNNMMQYLSLNGQNLYQANSNVENATKFKAFEYIDKEIPAVDEMVIDASLCDLLKLTETPSSISENNNSQTTKEESSGNPDTFDGVLYLFGILFTSLSVLGFTSYKIIKQ